MLSLNVHLKNVLFAIVTLLIVLWLYSARETPSLFFFFRVVFETVVSVKFFGGELGRAKLANMAFDSFVLVDSLMSSYRLKSEISRISNNLGDWVDCSIETIEVLQRAKYWAQITNGAYDPTIGCLTKAWEFQDNKSVPDGSKIDSLISCHGNFRQFFGLGFVKAKKLSFWIDIRILTCRTFLNSGYQ